MSKYLFDRLTIYTTIEIMTNLRKSVLVLLLSIPLHVAASESYQQPESNVYDNADIEQENISPDLVPKSAAPGESVEGRTEFTTPQQNKEIYNEYEKLQQDQAGE